MSFCKNCGAEVQDGVKFCENCGAPVEEKTEPKEAQNISSPVIEENAPSGIDKFGKFIGIILLILAFVCFEIEIPILEVLLAIVIIVGAIFCFGKKYKLKGFTIAALVIAIVCLFSGINDGKDRGFFKAPEKIDYEKQIEEIEKENAEFMKELEEKKAAEATAEEVNEPEVSTIEAAEEEETAEPEKTETVAGVDPELKAFLDSYEAFIDEYCEFMKKYKEDPNNAIAMAGEYAKTMGKYAEMAKKVEEYDSKEMSLEDQKYYLDVINNCNKKILEVAY